MGYPPEEQQQIADNLNCRLSSFPITYLGMPLGDTRTLSRDFDPLVKRVKAKAELWRGRFISKRRKSMLIDSCLSIAPPFI